MSIWRAPWLSFYSGRFYDDVGRRGRGAGLLYLLALVAATWLVSAIMLSSTFRRYVESDGQRLIAQVPPISIRDGKVKVEAPQPYFIRLEATGPDAIALDTTGEITSLEGRPDLAMLLTENKVHTRQRSGQIRIHDLSTTKSFDLNQAILRGWIDRYTGPFMAFGYFLAVLVSFVFRLLQALLYGAIGLGFASLFKKTLSYGGSVRMAIAAVTPVILIDSFLGWAGVTRASGWLWWCVCLAAALGFLAFGVKSLDERGDRA